MGARLLVGARVAKSDPLRRSRFELRVVRPIDYNERVVNLTSTPAVVDRVVPPTIAPAYVLMLRLCLVLSVALCTVGVRAQSPQRRAGLELFEKKIRPALIEYCYECHAEDSDDVGGELLLDSRDALLSGGETGPAIVPGKPADSLLMRALEFRDLEMPPDEKLPDEVIADFRRWISLALPIRGAARPLSLKATSPRKRLSFGRSPRSPIRQFPKLIPCGPRATPTGSSLPASHSKAFSRIRMLSRPPCCGESTLICGDCLPVQRKSPHSFPTLPTNTSRPS